MSVFWFWWLLLMAQNGSNTLVSRARNSGSFSFHALASVGSNGFWFFSQAIIIKVIVDAWSSQNPLLIVWTGLYYITFTVTGSVLMHHVSMTYIEKGNRRVGATRLNRP